jgi:hypothetical protein
MIRPISRIGWFFKWGFPEWFAQHCPVKIPTKRPICPELPCEECGKVMNKIVAYYDGDGWSFFWDCENECSGGEEPINNWYPFMFSAWCKGSDLARIGIKEV